jgi:hypothetical protein
MTVERVEIINGKICALVREDDGTLSALRWSLKDILDRAEAGMTSNISTSR